MRENTGGQPQIQSIVRAVAILQCFAGGKERGLTEVSKMVGLHKSTTSGLINTLKNVGFLEQDQRTGKLRLGLELFSLAVNARRDLAQICEPYLNNLLEMTRETVNLAVLDSGRSEIVYIAKKETTQSVRISTSIGKRLPIYCTAIGKAIMSQMSVQQTDKLIENLEFVPFTDRTLPDKHTLRIELDAIRSVGFACDDEEFEPGLVCIAVPLLNSFSEPIGAISVSGPVMRMDAETKRRIASMLCAEAAKICKEI